MSTSRRLAVTFLCVVFCVMSRTCDAQFQQNSARARDQGLSIPTIQVKTFVNKAVGFRTREPGFESSHREFNQNELEIDGLCMRCRDSNPRHSEHESPPTSTRPGLPPIGYKNFS